MMHLFKTRPDPKSNIDQNRSHMTFLNLIKDLGKPRHGLHGDEVFGILLIVHPCKHGTEDSGGEPGHL